MTETFVLSMTDWLPEWYCNQYAITGKLITWKVPLLIMSLLVRFFRVCFWPITKLTELIPAGDPIAIWELMSAIWSLGVALYLTFGNLRPNRPPLIDAIAELWPLALAAAILTMIGLGHLVALVHKGLVYRASVLTLSTTAWHVLFLIVIYKGGFVLSAPLLFGACIVGLVCIRILRGRENAAG